MRIRQLQTASDNLIYLESMEIQFEAAEKFRRGETDQAILMLQNHLRCLAEVDLDAYQLTSLKGYVEARIEQYKVLKDSGSRIERNVGSAVRPAMNGGSTDKRKAR